MIGKVQLDSFHGLGIRLDSSSDAEPLSPGLRSTSPCSGESLSSLLRDCQVGLGRPLVRHSSSPLSSSPKSPLPEQQQQQPSSRYKTELCRPYQEHGSCKYGEKCQFAHGQHELRNVNRHPKYKTDLCRTYHSVGFCPYGPRCHFIHALDELRSPPVSPQEKKSPGTVKQLPMYGGPGPTWTFPPKQAYNNINHHNNNNTLKTDMRSAAAQLGSFFNLNTANNHNSADSSRSGSLCSELDNLSVASGSPPSSATSSLDASCASSPLDVSRNLRLPIFNRLA